MVKRKLVRNSCCIFHLCCLFLILFLRNLSVNYKGIFHLNIFNNKKYKDLGSNQSMEDHSCFEGFVNGGTKSTQGFKNISTNNIPEEHSVNISKAVTVEAKLQLNCIPF